MKILLTGANGFIGGHIMAGLVAAGHEVVAAVRKPERLGRAGPGVTAIKADMNRDMDKAAWIGRLDGIDAVINCAGILQQRRGQSLWAIHRDAPIALFEACGERGVKRVIQISAVGIDAPTDYAASKKAADGHLQAMDLDWVILRPSLVYAEGAYGGTALMRALAACPYAIPLIGRRDYAFTPIHVADLVRTVLQSLEGGDLTRRVLEPCGPETLSMREILIRLRRWLGLSGERTVSIPAGLIEFSARIGDWIGAGPVTTTSLRQMDFQTDADPEAFAAAVGWRGRSMDQALAASPAQVQDRLHARLYGLRPLVWGALVILWLVSGVLGFTTDSSFITPYAKALGLNDALAGWIGPVTGAWDLVLALMILFRIKVVRAGQLQLATIMAYSAGISYANPAIWADPFGALLKNIPILALVLVWMVLEDER